MKQFTKNNINLVKYAPFILLITTNFVVPITF